MDNIPKKLRQLRRLKRMDNKQFAVFLGVSNETLKNWMNDNRPSPSIGNMEMLQDVFELEGVL